MSASRRDQLSIGFRLKAETASLRWRERIGAKATCRLDVDLLVQELGLPLLPLTEFGRQLPRHAYQLYIADGGAFSATAVCDGQRPLVIVYNDGHEPQRQRADVAHECAHLILDHTPSAVFDSAGRRTYPERLEAEAHWLGPTLLVPRDGLIEVLRKDPRLEAAAEHFHVSVPLARFVYNTRGCAKHVQLAA